MSGIGAFLRDRRVALGLSQEALAEAAGVSARSINRWEQGRALPQPDVRRRLAEVLGIDVAEFTAAGRSGPATEARSPWRSGTFPCVATHSSPGATGCSGSCTRPCAPTGPPRASRR